MNVKQARAVLKYAIVMRNGDPNFKGTVTLVGYSGFRVDWENGTAEWVDFQKAKQVDEWYPADAAANAYHAMTGE